jgi:hypothetical protein
MDVVIAHLLMSLGFAGIIGLLVGFWRIRQNHKKLEKDLQTWKRHVNKHYSEEIR